MVSTYISRHMGMLDDVANLSFEIKEIFVRTYVSTYVCRLGGSGQNIKNRL